jgi:hypothetical protein
MSRSGAARYICALLACMPDWLRREPYLADLAGRTRTPADSLRREVEVLARSGRAVEHAREYQAGREIPAVARAKAESLPVEPGADLVGWWNREKGETEDEFDFVYRTRYRLPIAQTMTEWGLVDEWLDRAEGYLAEHGWPWNEIKARNEIASEHLADPVAREAHELRHGAEIFDEDDTDYALLSSLEGALIDLSMSRSWDWWDTYEESVADGIPPELAAAKLIGLADR